MDPTVRPDNDSATEVVAIDRDGASEPTKLLVSAALARAIAIATAVKAVNERFDLTFASLFIGLLEARDPVASWLGSAFGQWRANRDALLDDDTVERRNVERVTSGPPVRPESRVRCSGSAWRALEEAQRQRDGIDRRPLQTRDVLAAYLTLPGFHEQDFGAMQIDREAWAASLAEAMSAQYSSEREFWRAFPNAVSAEVSTRAVPGTPRAPGGDAATTPDELDLASEYVETHVASALREADVRAGDALIEPRHVVAAAIQLAATAGSAAFSRLAEIVRNRPDAVTVSAPRPAVDAKRLSPGLRTQMAWVQRRTGVDGKRPRVWGRDLVTAALLASEPELNAWLSAKGQSIARVRALWHAFATADRTRRAPAEWDAWWRFANVPVPQPERAGYATETDEGDDKLGIAAEANALARLILDTKVEAPLSIGLLGDWGSGKSFFIEQIKAQVQALKDAKRADLRANVVEIEFNAWHASDTNLWASLVTLIFDKIWDSVSLVPDAATGKTAKAQLLEKITEAQGAVGAAEAQLTDARAALEQAERDLAQRRTTLATATLLDAARADALEKVARAAGWQGTFRTLGEVEAAARTLSQAGTRLYQLGAALFEHPLRRVVLPTAAVALVTAVGWYLLGRYSDTEAVRTVGRFTASAVGAVGAVVAPLRLASRSVAKLADKVAEARARFDAGSDTAEAKKAAAARRALEASEAHVATAKARLAELLSDQAGLAVNRRLGAFLQDRVQSTVYRSQQGIISLVRKDFEALSSFMKELRKSATAPAVEASPESKDASRAAPSRAPATIRPFDRIILYVDDLDRCRPAHVVHMLEAVHLLLALDLFVVVVAVDSRWLVRALEVHYRELLDADPAPDSSAVRGSTPQNYLEKIFQITYALGPMNPTHFGGYVAALAGAEESAASVAGDPQGSGEPRTERRTADTTPRDDARGETRVGGSDGASRGQGRTDGSGEKSSDETRRPDAPATAPAASLVRIDPDEREFICRLVPLIPTPRIAKRLVNVYRLIKSSKSSSELEEFERRGRSRSCLLMLAILFGQPTVAAELCRALHERRTPFADGGAPLVNAAKLRADDHAMQQGRAEWARLARTLAALNLDVTVGECAREPIEIARYSLVTGHDWHTWARA